MVIDIDKKTIEYINQKGGVINIDLITGSSCCVEVTEPIVDFNVPEKVSHFNEFNIEGVKIFVNKFVFLRDEKLTIKLNSFMGIKRISLSGIKLL